MAEKKETKSQKSLKESKPEETELHESEEMPRGNFVFVGKKGAMAYVLAVATQFGEGADEVKIKARGKSISRAVDVAEIVRNREPTISLKGISIATEEVVTMDGRPLKVSSIELTMTKK